MINNNFLRYLPLFLVLDLIIPFLLAPTYKGYNHITQVMSVLGNQKAPLHLVYNIWLVLLGVIILISSFQIYFVTVRSSKVVSIILTAIVAIYAIGGCILSGIFSVEETKSLETLSAKIHGYGSVVGFLLLTFAPLLIGIHFFKIQNWTFGILSLGCFMLTLIFFVLFVLADKPIYNGTFVASEGLWQRLSLFFMYLPLIFLSFQTFIECR